MLRKIHIKNNRWAEGSFPNTPEGEAVFTITTERFNESIRSRAGLREQLDICIDWDIDQFESSMASAEILLTWDFPTKDIQKVAPNLKWIHCIGAGVEHLLPMNWLPNDVVLTNNKGVHAAKAGEFGLMGVLMLHSHMPAVITNQRQKKYDSLYASPIAGKTVVVLGTGSLGGAIAEMISRLGVNVIGVNRSGRAVEGCSQVVTTDALDAVLPQADYLVIATPDTPQTRGLMNRSRLGLLKKSAGVMNIGREAVMDYGALCDKLEDGSLGGAILDVFDPEPVKSDSRLWTTPNLIMTPHISADDGDAYIALTLNLFFDNLERYLAGKSLLNPVDPAQGY
jgi:phosphoglycerate dehydrogenase-like enzyme